jgi:ligand-binding sensor domain-containing protein
MKTLVSVFIIIFSIALISCKKEKYDIEDKSKWITYSTKDGLGSNVTWCLSEDVHENIYVGTMRGISTYIHEKNTFNWTYPDEISIYSIYCSDSGLVTATEYGAVFFGNSSFFMNELDYISTDILFDNEYYWLTTKNAGVYVFNELETFRLKFNANKVYKCSNSLIWILSPYGIDIYRSLVHIKEYTNKNGLSSNYCNDIIEDSQNRIWVGTDSEYGLCQIMQDTIICHEFPYINAIAEDKEGNLWLGSSTFGVYKWEPNGNRINYTLLDGLPSNRITDILVAKDGSVWISTEDAGVARYQPKK